MIRYVRMVLIGLCALLALSPLCAQSSLYQDALKVAEILKKDLKPKLVFKANDGSQLVLMNEEEDREKVIETLIFQQAYQSYDFEIRTPQERVPNDTIDTPPVQYQIRFSYGDTSMVIPVPKQFSFYYSNDYYVFYTEAGPLLEIYDESVEKAYQNIRYIFGYHRDFDRLSKPDFRFSPKETLMSYQKNPFLPSTLRDNSSFSISNAPESDWEEEFVSSFYHNYPWQRLMSKDSVLDLQRSISIEDISSSYRRPIVTSEVALNISTSQINQSSQDRGLLDARSVAAGLSDFIAERAQEELNLTFFSRLKKNLEEPSELTLLFPETKNLFLNFEISDYKSLLTHARTTFEQDLNDLGLNFPKILTLDKYQELNNDPNVFNLSLIYTIADLAYKEQPVETILLSAHQSLLDRQINLQRSIHQKLADSLVQAPSTPINGKTNSSQKRTQAELSLANLMLDSLRNMTTSYLDSIEILSYKLGDLGTNKLISAFEREVSSIQELEYSDISSELIESTYMLEYDVDYKISTDDDRYLEATRYNSEESIQFQNRELGEFMTPFNHFKLVVPKHLNGKEFYQYLINDPREGEHEQFFDRVPPAQNELVAQGLDELQDILRRNYTTKMMAFQNTLRTQTDTLKAVKLRHLLLREDASGGILQQVTAFDRRFQSLAIALEREIVFWSALLQDDGDNHYVAGLRFLSSFLHQTDDSIYVPAPDEDKNKREDSKGKKAFDANSIWQVRDLAHKLTAAAPEKAQQILAQPEFAGLKNNFSVEFQRAENRLNYVEQRFIEQIKLIIDHLGEMRPAQEFYDICSRVALLTVEEQTLIEERYFWDQVLFKKTRMIYNGTDPLSPDRTLLDSAEEELFAFQKEIEEHNETYFDTALLSDSALIVYDRIYERYSNLYMAYDSAANTITQEWRKKSEPYQKNVALTVEINSIADTLYSTKSLLPTLVNTSATAPTIRERYNWEDNTAYQRYRELTDAPAPEASPDLPEITDINNQLRELDISLGRLQNLEYQIDRLLDDLGRTYCPNLVKAKENADFLAKSIEVSAHLLFAFRNYDHDRQVLTYQDSTYIEVTTSKRNEVTGLLETYRMDSLQVIERPIVGTADQMNAARWVTREEFDALRRDETAWNIFLTLLYQRLNSIENGPNFAPEGVALLATKFLQIANDVETNIDQLRLKRVENPDDVGFKDYYPFIRSTVDLFNTVLITPSISSTDGKLLAFTEQSASAGVLSVVPRISNEALSLYENIYVEDYGSAVLNTMELLKLITNHNLDDKDQRIQSTRAINAVLTYGTFMANMLQAQNSSQVQAILQAATLPPGSSRIKREVTSSITINSYLGIAGGQDRLLEAPSDLDATSLGAALSVPIGVTYSFSPNFIKNKSSFSIHVPLLDLGAVTAFRQAPDNPVYNVNRLPEFEWRNLFSPGFFLVYNVANSPFSFGAGGQYGPQLREIQIGGSNEPLFLNSWRFPMVFFSVDVPFFNLYTGARKIVVK